MALVTRILETGTINSATDGDEFSPQMLRDGTGHAQITVLDNPTSFTLRFFGRANGAVTTGWSPVLNVTNAASNGVNSTDWSPSPLADGSSVITISFPLWPHMRCDVVAISGTGSFVVDLIE